MALVADYLGCKVFGRAAQSVGDSPAVGVRADFSAFAGGAARGRWGKVFGEAEVDEFEVAV